MLRSCQFAFLNLRIAKSILSETTNIYPAQGSGLWSPRVLLHAAPPSWPDRPQATPSHSSVCPNLPPAPSHCPSTFIPLARSHLQRLPGGCLSHASSRTGGWQFSKSVGPSFSILQLVRTAPPRPSRVPVRSVRRTPKSPRPELIFPSDTSQVGPILIFTPYAHTHTSTSITYVCVCECAAPGKDF